MSAAIGHMILVMTIATITKSASQANAIKAPRDNPSSRILGLLAIRTSHPIKDTSETISSAFIAAKPIRQIRLRLP